MPISIKQVKEYEALGIPISNLHSLLKKQAYTITELVEELKVQEHILRHHMTKQKRVEAKIKDVKVGHAVYYYMDA